MFLGRRRADIYSLATAQFGNHDFVREINASLRRFDSRVACRAGSRFIMAKPKLHDGLAYDPGDRVDERERGGAETLDQRCVVLISWITLTVYQICQCRSHAWPSRA
jgi:hypothetical protein